jgi:hypothetical protein
LPNHQQGKHVINLFNLVTEIKKNKLEGLALVSFSEKSTISWHEELTHAVEKCPTQVGFDLTLKIAQAGK